MNSQTLDIFMVCGTYRFVSRHVALAQKVPFLFLLISKLQLGSWNWIFFVVDVISLSFHRTYSKQELPRQKSKENSRTTPMGNKVKARCSAVSACESEKRITLSNYHCKLLAGWPANQSRTKVQIVATFLLIIIHKKGHLWVIPTS